MVACIFFPFPECKRKFLAFQWRGWRSECQKEECGWCCQSLGTTTMIHFFAFRSFRSQPTPLNVFGWESYWIVFDFVQIIAKIRRESENRQPLHFWTWDPIHNSAGSDYHWGRWSIDIGFIQSSITMLRNVTQKYFSCIVYLWCGKLLLQLCYFPIGQISRHYIQVLKWQFTTFI